MSDALFLWIFVVWFFPTTTGQVLAKIRKGYDAALQERETK